MAGFLKMTFYVVLLAVLYKQVLRLFETTLPLHTGGYAAPGWEKVADVYKQQVVAGLERGGIFTVYYKGELVVEVFGGYADEEAQVPWDRETLCVYMSTSKLTGALVLAMLVDRGLMSYSDLVADHWPEFAQNEKESVTVKQLVSHQAGLAAIEEPFSYYDLRDDPEKLGSILAAAKPEWTPGEKHGYHAVTIGLYEDQLVRRVDPQHRSLAQFFQEEVAEPFDIDFYLGLPRTEAYRMSRVQFINFLSTDLLFATKYYKLHFNLLFNSMSLTARAVNNPPEMMQPGIQNHPSFREIPSASSNGYGTGASIAKLAGILANGGTYGDQELLSPEMIDKLGTPVMSGIDLNICVNVTYGLGVIIKQAPHGGNIFGCPGAGGQYGFADLKHHLGWSHLTNHHSMYHLADVPHIIPIEEAMYDCVKAIENS